MTNQNSKLTSKQKQELKELFGENVAFDFPLSQQTSIHVGGPADAILWPMSEEELQRGVQWARAQKIPYFVLGKGSNTLVKDGGFRGMVIHLGKGFRNFSLSRENGRFVWVQAQGGVPTQQLVHWCAEQGFSGMERLAGIPGTIGGNVYMNAGTYLGEIKDILETIILCDAKGKIQTVEKVKLNFEYRSSNLPASSVVLGATLKLEKGEKEAIAKKIRVVFEKRGLSQPIEMPNLGSVFKNPGKKKAWELVEEAGLKGVRVGQARVSEKHGNFIVNEGGASAKDVLILIHLIKDKVKQVSGISLETEIKVIGEEK